MRSKYSGLQSHKAGPATQYCSSSSKRLGPMTPALAGEEASASWEFRSTSESPL